MFRLLTQSFQRRADLLLEGRYEVLARDYVLPLPVQLGDCAIRIDGADEMAVHLRRHHVALMRRSTTDMRPQIIAVELPRGAGLQRVWLRWHMTGAAGPMVSQAVYGCQPADQGGRIEWMCYTRLAMPEFGRSATHRRLVVR